MPWDIGRLSPRTELLLWRSSGEYLSPGAATGLVLAAIIHSCCDPRPHGLGYSCAALRANGNSSCLRLAKAFRLIFVQLESYAVSRREDGCINLNQLIFKVTEVVV